MNLIFTKASLGNMFNELTSAARRYIPPQQYVEKADVSGLMDAAVRFTIQLAIDAADYDQVHARALERALITKLATWFDTKGAGMLRLWSHDMSCVIGELALAAHDYAHPSTTSSAGVVEYVMATLPRNLAVAAVAFSIQLVLEVTELPAVAVRSLESALICKLEAPWDFGETPLSADVQDGPTWEALSEKKCS